MRNTLSPMQLGRLRRDCRQKNCALLVLPVWHSIRSHWFGPVVSSFLPSFSPCLGSSELLVATLAWCRYAHCCRRTASYESVFFWSVRFVVTLFLCLSYLVLAPSWTSLLLLFASPYPTVRWKWQVRASIGTAKATLGFVLKLTVFFFPRTMRVSDNIPPNGS